MMKIKAGRYTLGLTFIGGGVLLLLKTLNMVFIPDGLWIYSPLLLVLFGLEVLALSMIYSGRENYKVELSGGSIVLLVFFIAILTVVTRRTDIQNTIFNAFVSI